MEKMELISREIIKPSLPTPPHLTIYPLGFIDYLISPLYVPLLLFYSPIPNQDNTHDQTLASKISSLKISLSKVLSRYYPFAGTLNLKDQICVDCNDQGVSLIVTKLTCNLSWILNNPTEASLNPLFPDELPWKTLSSTLLSIQINCFACGGIAIGLCMCHKVGDVATLSYFVNDWATLNRQKETEFTLLPSPVPAASFFPLENLPLLPEATFVKNDAVICTRLVFEASKIDSLKAIVSSQNVPNPTRVQVVSALIYKRAISSLGLSLKKTSFRTAVNLRRITVPPLPEKIMGNLVWSVLVDTRENTKEVHELVLKMKQGLTKLSESCVRNLGEKERDLKVILESLMKAATVPEPGGSGSDEEKPASSFIYSSWCGFGMYEADFGWGKPVRCTTSVCPVKNIIILMDTGDGGIEAIVNLEEQDMVRFQRDVELLQYARIS